ncbi:hypothetical protein EYF80_014445 [Liparis tanakae]|uniref:Uncharacterized protein n=1 Tax=Liparis tanakae TaxID=230148 RepID=A0A4Z2IBL0_9TELE|nr:hypothetical protein EYF80_014445 [Liparis tanakae]
MGEGQPRLLVVGPLAVVPPPLGPFVTGASMLLMIWSGAKRRRRRRRRSGTTERNPLDVGCEHSAAPALPVRSPVLWTDPTVLLKWYNPQPSQDPSLRMQLLTHTL